MPVRTLSTELQKKAENELNEDSNRIKETLEHLRKWLQKQPHLKVNEDCQNLISFVRGTKWSIQRAKEKIDSFYRARTVFPEFFHNRDPISSEIQKVLQAGIILPLNKKNDLDSKIIYFRLCNLGINEIPLASFSKVFFMILDILLHENDDLNISGLTVIGDYKDMPLNYIVHVSPRVVKAFLICVLSGYPVRVKTLTSINIHEIFEKVLSGTIKSFLNKKMQAKISFYSTSGTDQFYKHIDKSVLPKDLGGENDSFLKISEQWKHKVESYRSWFLEDAKYCSNESLRLNRSKHINDEFGVDGTFRNLTLD